MKKNFLLLALLIFALPCLFLVGCGEKELYKLQKVDSSIGYLIEKGTFKQSINEYGSYDESHTDLMTGDYEKGKVVIGDIIIKSYYNPETLKLFANGQEIEYVANNNIDTERDFNEFSYILAGSFEFVLNEDTELSFSCEELAMSFSFKVEDESTLTAEKRTLIEDIYFDDNTRLINLIDNNQNGAKYQTTFSKIFEGLTFQTDKHNGYYSFVNYNEVEPVCFAKGQMIISTQANTNNKYKISFNEKTLYANNEIIIDPKSIDYQKVSVQNNSGNILSFTAPNSNSFENISTKDANFIVTITINEYYGANISNAKLYCNETELLPASTSPLTYQLDLSKMPVEYLQPNSEDWLYIESNGKYQIELKNVTFDSLDNICAYEILSTNTAGVNTNRFWNNEVVYYFDRNQTVYIPASERSFTFNYNVSSVGPYEKPNTLTLSRDGEQDIVINLAKHLDELKNNHEFTIGDITIWTEDFSSNAYESYETTSYVWVKIINLQVGKTSISFTKVV